MTQLIKRNFEGRPLKHLGMHSQIIHNNSKLKGPHLLDPLNEGDDDITHIIQAIFPRPCIQFSSPSTPLPYDTFSRAGRKRRNCSGST